MDAARGRPVVVVALAAGDGANDQPDDEQYQSDPHYCLRQLFLLWVICSDNCPIDGSLARTCLPVTTLAGSAEGFSARLKLSERRYSCPARTDSKHARPRRATPQRGAAGVCRPPCRVVPPAAGAAGTSGMLPPAGRSPPGRKESADAQGTDQGREDIHRTAQARREQAEVCPDRERLGQDLPPCGSRQGRQEPVLCRLEQAGPADQGKGNRHQGPVTYEQEPAH